MNGAESLIKTAVEAGIEVCFANPGTTEMPVVAAMDTVDGMRGVLCVHETVVTGAADGYGRMAGKPALTLLHLGPGFANGIANLHNARRAGTPLINLIGEHATWHIAADAPLTSDIEGLAGPVSAWVGRSESADGMAGDLVAALEAATDGGGKIATLILPHDLQLAAAKGGASLPSTGRRAEVPGARIDAAAAALQRDGAVLFLGDAGLSEAAMLAAGRIVQATGATLMAERAARRAERGQGLPGLRYLPYLPEQAMEALAGFSTIVFAGSKDPVSFFGYEGFPSYMVPEGCEKVRLAEADEDIAAALEAVAEALGAGPYQPVPAAERPALPSGSLDAEGISTVIAALQPEGAVLVDEAITSGWAYRDRSESAPRFCQLTITGGAIGHGPACATGAAVGAPDRQVINFQADGSGLYSSQALWTQARERLNVVTVICANRRYEILQMELRRAGLNQPGPQARALTDLGDPHIEWTKLAEGYGVPAVQVDTGEALAGAFSDALAAKGPVLIEALI